MLVVGVAGCLEVAVVVVVGCCSSAAGGAVAVVVGFGDCWSRVFVVVVVRGRVYSERRGRGS